MKAIPAAKGDEAALSLWNDDAATTVAPARPGHGLDEQIAVLDHGEHVCMIYEDDDARLRGVVPFIHTGLSKGDLCMYIADERSTKDVEGALSGLGMDVEQEIRRGALRFMTKQEVYLHDGTFDPHEMILYLEKAVLSAVEEGFRGFRVTGEMTWSLGPGIDTAKLIEYEAHLNRFFPGSRSMGLCQYDRRRFKARVIKDVLRTHPLAVLGDQVCHNLYYEPPEFVLEGGHEEDRVSWMISQLQDWHRLSVSRDELLREVTRRKRYQADLEQVAAALERSNRELEHFAYVASHDLQEPLRTISGYAQLLQRRYGDRLDDQAQKYIQRTIAGTKRMERLIQDLLEYSRVTTQGDAFRDVDLGGVMESVLADVEHLVRRRGAEVRVGRLPVVQGDASQLHRVLLNLVTNAIRYTPDDRVPIVEVDTQDDADAWHLIVEDNGEGIPENQYERVFVLFQRLVPREPGDLGTGMGLAIAKRIVERHGGKIWVESIRNEGSVFHFTLPKRKQG